jgi:hypothetical protein
MKKHERNKRRMKSKEYLNRQGSTSIYSNMYGKAVNFISVVTSDINDLFRNNKSDESDIESVYKVTHINELKGNWNIIIPDKSKVTTSSNK